MPRSNAARKAQEPTPQQSDSILALQERLATLEAENAQLRRVAPVAPRNIIDSGDMQIGPGDGAVTLPSDGEPRLNRPDIVLPDGPQSKSKLDELAFMEEEVVVEVAESSDPRDGLCISVWNYGRHQLFIRGREITCKRKFLEVLARAKPTSYGSVEYVDATGARAYKYPKRTSQRYQFRVVRDDNPRGRDWLRKVLAQP